MLEYPSWEDVVYSLLETPQVRSLNISSKGRNHIFKSLAAIDSIRSLITPMEMITLTRAFFNVSDIAPNKVTHQEVMDFENSHPIEKNEFQLLASPKSDTFQEVGARAKELLDLPAAEELNLPRICGFDTTYELFHPCDVNHIIRIGTAVLMSISVDGLLIHPFSDYYEVKFRIGWSDKQRKKRILRRCQLGQVNTEETESLHFDKWEVTAGHGNFEHVDYRLHAKNQESQDFLASLIFIYNAMMIKTKPRDAILSHFVLNRQRYYDGYSEYLREAKGVPGDFTYEKQEYLTFKSELMKKLKDRVIRSAVTVDGYDTKSELESRNDDYYIRQLGLNKCPSLVRDLVAQNIRHQPN